MRERLSGQFYVWSIAVGYGLAALLFIISWWKSQHYGPQIGAVWSLWALVPLVYSVVIWLRLVFVIWEAIQDGYARVTPGKAVGLLLIPFFNFYWVFRAVACFPKDYNEFVDRHELKAPKLEPHMFVAFSVLFCAGSHASFALIIVGAILARRICDAVNLIPEGELIPANDAPAERPLPETEARRHEKVTPGPFDFGAMLREEE